jgi:hypothetical protein
MTEKRMTLKANFKNFIDEDGNELDLTEQAKTIFKFLTTIVSTVSENINQPLIDVDLSCSSRAAKLSCDGCIKAKCIAIGMIEWHCDTCEASGTVSNWQGCLWDMQERTIH